jgi:hypothetical protein
MTTRSRHNNSNNIKEAVLLVATFRLSFTHLALPLGAVRFAAAVQTFGYLGR